MKRNILLNLTLIIVLFFTIASAKAQEVVTGLFQNPVLKDKPEVKASIKSENILTLPFFEDFTRNSAYPDDSKWIDQYVFVNKDFAIDPPNHGVATFDVLDRSGNVYSHASIQPFIADYLSSSIIRLDSVFAPNAHKLSPSDSVYFSFSYQIQGRGDRPEELDSLVLQFGYPSGNMILDFVDSVLVPVDLYLIANQIDSIFPNDTLYAPEGCNQELYLVADEIMTWGEDVMVPCDTVFKPEITWNSVWSVPGVSIQDSIIPSSDQFYQVSVAIINPVYFVNDFRFRFFNYGSIASTINPGNRGNVDQWNLDMVYVSNGRRKNDLSYSKVSFSERAPSFLKRYESMPYKQYRSDPTNAVKAEFEMKITNQDKVTHQTHYWYQVVQNQGSQKYVYDGGSCDLLPFNLGGYQSCSSSCGSYQACPPVNSLFALQMIDTTSFTIKHFVSDSTQPYLLADSLSYHQGFYNYFAYDDGTPELGYGIEPLGASVAVQFAMAVPDTLQGVQLFFNRTLNQANYKYFDIVVWSDNNGRPGNELYRKEQQHPRWSNDLYGFSMYSFENPPIVSGVFYVGLYQSESGSLNIGYDMARNSSDYTFYKVAGDWNNSQYSGSLMIRPVVGSSDFIGVQEQQNAEEEFVKIYPNPATETISLIALDNDFKSSEISLFDLSGRVLHKQAFQSGIDVRFLDNGLYFISLQCENGKSSISKLMISR
jgi:hypothetical protein